MNNNKRINTLLYTAGMVSVLMQAAYMITYLVAIPITASMQVTDFFYRAYSSFAAVLTLCSLGLNQTALYRLKGDYVKVLWFNTVSVEKKLPSARVIKVLTVIRHMSFFNLIMFILAVDALVNQALPKSTLLIYVIFFVFCGWLYTDRFIRKVRIKVSSWSEDNYYVCYDKEVRSKLMDVIIDKTKEAPSIGKQDT